MLWSSIRSSCMLFIMTSAEMFGKINGSTEKVIYELLEVKIKTVILKPSDMVMRLVVFISDMALVRQDL